MTKGEIWTVTLLGLTLVWQIIVQIVAWSKKARIIRFVLVREFADENNEKCVMIEAHNEGFKIVKIKEVGAIKENGEIVSIQRMLELYPGKEDLYTLKIDRRLIGSFYLIDSLGKKYKQKI